MKRHNWLYGMTLASCFAAGTVSAAGAEGAAVVDSVESDGAILWRTNAVPSELIGRYLYEKQGEPIIELNADGTGTFQAHGVPAMPIKYWMLSDEKGELVKASGGTKYRYTVVLQYGPGGGGNYPEGTYATWYWTMDTADNCANILGERFKCG